MKTRIIIPQITTGEIVSFYACVAGVFIGLGLSLFMTVNAFLTGEFISWFGLAVLFLLATALFLATLYRAADKSPEFSDWVEEWWDKVSYFLTNFPFICISIMETNGFCLLTIICALLLAWII